MLSGLGGSKACSMQYPNSWGWKRLEPDFEWPGSYGWSAKFLLILQDLSQRRINRASYMWVWSIQNGIIPRAGANREFETKFWKVGALFYLHGKLLPHCLQSQMLKCYLLCHTDPAPPGNPHTLSLLFWAPTMFLTLYMLYYKRLFLCLTLDIFMFHTPKTEPTWQILSVAYWHPSFPSSLTESQQNNMFN